MFTSFPHALRRFGIRADSRSLIELYRCMSYGLVLNLGDLHRIGMNLIVKDRRQLAGYTFAFVNHFLDINLDNTQLDEELKNSELYIEWIRKQDNIGENPYRPELVFKFLDDVLQTSGTINERLSGRGLLDKDDPDRDDQGGGRGIGSGIEADYSDVPLKELEEWMQRVAEQQKEAHSGGGHWIGTGGYSPYGHSGRGLGGIRIGGRGSSFSAREVLGNPRYYPVDLHSNVTDNNIDAALAALKGVSETSINHELDIQRTIEEGARRGGLFVPNLKAIEEQRLHVLLFIDNGGWSMKPYEMDVSRLFARMKRRFEHDLVTYYFHNAIESKVYTDEAHKIQFPLERILDMSPYYRVFVVGDACMGRDELFESEWLRNVKEPAPIECLKAMSQKFPNIAWLNPMEESMWNHPTVKAIAGIAPMYRMSPYGISQAVAYMNRNRNQNR